MFAFECKENVSLQTDLKVFAAMMTTTRKAHASPRIVTVHKNLRYLDVY